VSVCPFARLSVCLPPQQRAAGLLLWARRVDDIDRLLHTDASRRAAANARCATFLPRDVRCATAVYAIVACPFFRPSVRHKPVLYQIHRTNRAGFWREAKADVGPIV